jgi:hypothetical protein
MGIGQKLVQILPFLARNLVANQARPYERVLAQISTRKDIWTPSQGEYIKWWREREQARLEVMVVDGQCHVSTSLENAVVERFPVGVRANGSWDGSEREYLECARVPCPGTTFEGPVWLTIDSGVHKKELLVELLRREGILNLRTASEGTFVLSQEEVGPLLDQVEANMNRPHVAAFEEQVAQLRQIVRQKLAEHHLPLLRVWYHPRRNGTVVRAVLTVRLDVDRAITNLPRIRAIETQYGVTSTLYIRADCPFYTERSVQELAAKPWCPELALHGEFVDHAARYGGEAAAALADKTGLGALVGRPITGVAMHGGEMSSNKSLHTAEAIQYAGLEYDTTMGATQHLFPFRGIAYEESKKTNGRHPGGVRVNSYHTFPLGLGDFSLLPFKPLRRYVNGRLVREHTLTSFLRQVPGSWRDHQSKFYEAVMAKMEAVYEGSGVFLLVLHPSYFGFLAYLARPKNVVRIVSFLGAYLGNRGNVGRGRNHSPALQLQNAGDDPR